MADTPRVTVPEAIEALKHCVENEKAHWSLSEICDPCVDVPVKYLRAAVEALSAAPAPEDGAVKGPGDYTMCIAEPKTFERFPALASHIERMAVGRSVGSLIEWDAFLRELNAALATREEAPAEAGEGFTPVTGLWKDRRLSRLERVKAHRMEFRSELKQAIEAVDEEASRQSLSALRAQPPAREDAQPVAWVKALEDLKSYHPEDEDLAIIKQKVVAVFEAAHPAPDALRVAVEALEPFARLELPKKPVGNAGAWSLLHSDIRRAKEALAALQAEQGAK